jgi:hypothetical protein
MQRLTGIVVLVVGIILMVYGVNASQSPSSEISKFFTGAATNKALYLLVGGAVAVIAGGSMAATAGRKRG